VAPSDREVGIRASQEEVKEFLGTNANAEDIIFDRYYIRPNLIFPQISNEQQRVPTGIPQI
jgi:hypothetical protein